MHEDDNKKRLKGTLNLPKTDFAMKANLPAERARAARRLGGPQAAGRPLRPDPGRPRRRAQVHPARRPALRQRRHPPRPRAQQVHQGLRRQDQDDGRLRRPLRPRLGLPRPAHRDQSRRKARRQKAGNGPRRRPPGLPRVRRRSTSTCSARSSSASASSAAGTTPTAP